MKLAAFNENTLDTPKELFVVDPGVFLDMTTIIIIASHISSKIKK